MGYFQMKTYTLLRGYQDTRVTLGMLKGLSRPIYTLEEPWMHNKRGMSCIPTGEYICTPHDGAKFKNVWRLLDVKDRTAILIHAGNTTADIEGCILVGFDHGIFRGKRAVLRSKLAIELMREEIGKNPFRLIIKE